MQCAKIFYKKYIKNLIYSILIILLISSSISAQNTITNEEDRSEYFRNEIISSLSQQQILNYLTRKETAENAEPKDLAAKYILKLIQPYDRKIDAAIGESWLKLSSAEKDSRRLEWFNQNKNSISTREVQKFIMIDDYLIHAREAEQQRLKRERREQIEFSGLMSEPEFMSHIDKAAKQIDITTPKPEQTQQKKEIPQRSVTRRQPTRQTRPAAQSAKKSAPAKSIPQKTTSKPTDLISDAKTRDLSKETTSPRATTASPQIQPRTESGQLTKPQDKALDDRIKQLQNRVETLKKQVKQNDREIDSLKNFGQ